MKNYEADWCGTFARPVLNVVDQVDGSDQQWTHGGDRFICAREWVFDDVQGTKTKFVCKQMYFLHKFILTVPSESQDYPCMFVRRASVLDSASSTEPEERTWGRPRRLSHIVVSFCSRSNSNTDKPAAESTSSGFVSNMSVSIWPTEDKTWAPTNTGRQN